MKTVINVLLMLLMLFKSFLFATQMYVVGEVFTESW